MSRSWHVGGVYLLDLDDYTGFYVYISGGRRRTLGAVEERQNRACAAMTHVDGEDGDVRVVVGHERFRVHLGGRVDLDAHFIGALDQMRVGDDESGRVDEEARAARGVLESCSAAT